MTCAMWFTSRRVPWKALLPATEERSRQIGVTPRSRAASALSTTRAAAPMPMTMPCRRRSNGRAASSTFSSSAAAPEATNPAPIHSIMWSERGVVGRDDQDATAAACADPVLGEAHGKTHRAAGRVDLSVRAARADELGELRVPHREDPEEEAAIEGVGRLLEELPEGGDLLVDVGEGLRRRRPGWRGRLGETPARRGACASRGRCCSP